MENKEFLKLKKLYLNNVPVAEICNIMCMKERKVRVLLSKNGINRSKVKRKPSKEWSSKEVSLLKEKYTDKNGVDFLIKKLNRPEITIRTKARFFNLKGYKAINDLELVEKIKNNHNDYSMRQMGKMFHISPKTVGDIIRHHNIPFKVKPSIPVGSVKWTDQEIKKLKSLYKKYTVAEIMPKIGRTHAAIRSKLKEFGIKK